MRRILSALLLSIFLLVPAAVAKGKGSKHLSNKAMRKQAIVKKYKKNKKLSRAKYGAAHH